MNKIILVLMVLSSSLQGNSFWNKKSDVQPVPPEYVSISVSGNGTLHLVHSSEKPILKNMRVENGALIVELKNGEQAYLHLKSLSPISVRGDATVKSDDQFDIQDFTVIASENGKLFLALKGKFVNVLLQDSAEVLLSGVVGEQNAVVQGNSQYEAASLFTQTATVNVSGHGKAMVNVVKELTADVSDDGLLMYGGDPESVKKSVQGKGIFKPLY